MRVSSTADPLRSAAQTSAFGARSAIAIAIAPEPLPTSATVAGSDPRRANARSTRRSVAGRGVITRPGAVSSWMPEKLAWSKTPSTPSFVSPEALVLQDGAASAAERASRRSRELQNLLAASQRAEARVLLAAPSPIQLAATAYYRLWWGRSGGPPVRSRRPRVTRRR